MARKLSEESSVLLKNDDNILPLSQNPKGQKILIIGGDNNTFAPQTHGSGSGYVDASIVIPPAWEISDKLGVKRITNTANPSRSCNITNGNCVIYGGHSMEKIKQIPAGSPESRVASR